MYINTKQHKIIQYIRTYNNKKLYNTSQNFTKQHKLIYINKIQQNK